MTDLHGLHSRDRVDSDDEVEVKDTDGQMDCGEEEVFQNVSPEVQEVLLASSSSISAPTRLINLSKLRSMKSKNGPCEAPLTSSI